MPGDLSDPDDRFILRIAPLVKELAKLRAEHDTLSGGNQEGPTEAQSAEDIGRQVADGTVGDTRTMLG